MGVLKHHPRLRWVPHDFFALKGLLKSFEVHRIAQIVLVAQYIGDGRCVPVVWVVEVTPARSACPLVSQHPRSKDLQLSQVPGDFAGAVAFSGHLEDQPDNWSGFRVNGQMALRCLADSRRGSLWRSAHRSCPWPEIPPGSSCWCPWRTTR